MSTKTCIRKVIILEQTFIVPEELMGIGIRFITCSKYLENLLNQIEIDT